MCVCIRSYRNIRNKSLRKRRECQNDHYDCVENYVSIKQVINFLRKKEANFRIAFFLGIALIDYLIQVQMQCNLSINTVVQKNLVILQFRKTNLIWLVSQAFSLFGMIYFLLSLNLAFENYFVISALSSDIRRVTQSLFKNFLKLFLKWKNVSKLKLIVIFG